MKNLIAVVALLLVGALFTTEAQARVVSKSVVVQRGFGRQVAVQRIVAVPAFGVQQQLILPTQQLIVPSVGVGQLNYGGVQQLNFGGFAQPQAIISSPSVGVGIGGGCRSQLFFSR